MAVFPYSNRGGNGGLNWYDTPPAQGNFKGEIIYVPNPAVPRGMSRLEWTGSIWCPPVGELIAGAFASSSVNPLVLVTPGVTTLTTIMSTSIIPDYMLPNLLEWDVCATMGAQNLTGTGTCLLGVSISGNVTSIDQSYYAIASNTSPTQSPNYSGLDPSGSYRVETRRGNNIKHPWSATRDFYDYPNSQPFISNSNKLYAVAVPDSTSTIIRLDSMAAYSRGNL
jgi:hypothetical protein